MQRDAAERYLDQYPKLRKWVRICVACGKAGHSPEMPEQRFPLYRGYYHVRRYFPEAFELDRHGRCPVCSDAVGTEK